MSLPHIEHRPLTYAEVAEIIGVPIARVADLGRQGLIPTVRLGRQRRVSPDALNEFIRSGGKDLNGGWRRVAR